MISLKMHEILLDYEWIYRKIKVLELALRG